jgi:hypothetical protein
MIRLGYLDEDKGNRNTFHRVFKKYFEVVMLDDNTKLTSVDMVLEEIDNLKLDVLAVDFRLADSGWVSFNGDEVVRAIWDKHRYFPVFMLTSYVNNAIEKMDNVFLINDKDGLSDPDRISLLKRQIIGSVDTFHRIISEKNSRLKELVEKQKTIKLNDEEEKELLNLNIEMSKIDPKANPISPDMMQTRSVEDLREMVDLTRTLLKSIKGEQ